MTKTGLTLGKYAPLHKGHQFVIETAIQEMDHVIVLIYDAPEATNIPLPVRANWIRQLYPKVEVIEAWDGPTQVSSDPLITRQHDEYILKKLNGRRITHFYSSEFYGNHVSMALHAENRQIDSDRINVPISGTQIRENTYACRPYIDPLVYRDLIINVAFLGAPSSGKTTIAQRMADEWNTTWMPEYGREFWEQHQVNRRMTLPQLTQIAQEHLIREDNALLQANRFLFTDTNALTTYLFSLDYHNQAERQLAHLANQITSRYDLVFLCDIDIPYEDTWDRSGEVNRSLFHRRTRAELATRKIPYTLLSGSLDARVEAVNQRISRFQKYDNILAMK
ncbi:AAA family ATPase [Lacunimicrobium album]